MRLYTKCLLQRLARKEGSVPSAHMLYHPCENLKTITPTLRGASLGGSLRKLPAGCGFRCRLQPGAGAMGVRTRWLVAVKLIGTAGDHTPSEQRLLEFPRFLLHRKTIPYRNLLRKTLRATSNAQILTAPTWQGRLFGAVHSRPRNRM